jgi:predicted metal-dependent hydrolase
LGLFFFNDGRYFEAHEAWEDLWRVTGPPLRTFYQGLIQAAVGLHHLERGNRIGALGQLSKSIGHLSETVNASDSIDTAGLIRQLQEIRSEMHPRPVRIVRIK